MSASYVPLARSEDEDTAREVEAETILKASVALSIEDKWRLAKPMLTKYMLPLCKSPHRTNSCYASC